MTEYLVVIEGGGDSWSAYVPDLPGCVSAGVSREEVEQLIREAIAFHIESMGCHLPVLRDHPVASNMGPPCAHRRQPPR